MKIRSWLLAVCCAASLVGAARADDDFAPRADAQVKEWYQRRGNAARSGVSTFEPVRHAPEIAWRTKLAGERVSNLVTWDGVVFVVVKDSKGATLQAYDTADGSEAGSRHLKYDDDAELAVWNGTVVVQQPSALTFYGYKQGSYRLPIAWEGRFSGAPLVHDGKVYAIEGGLLTPCKVGGRRPEFRLDRAEGWPSAQLVHGKVEVTAPCVTFQTGYKGDYFFLEGWRPQYLMIRKAKPRPDGPALCAHRLETTTAAGRENGWLFLGPVEVLASGGDSFPGVVVNDFTDSFWPYSVTSPVVVLKGTAYGWNRDRELISISLSGMRTLLDASAKPDGFAGSELSAARDVLYVGNMAVEMASARVLWCAKEIRPRSVMVPCGERRLLAEIEGGELICLTEPASEGAPAGSTATSATGPAAPPVVPHDDDGVLLAGGRHVLGAVSVLDDGRVRVKPAEGAAEEFDEAEVAVAVAGGKAVGPRDEFLCYRVWRDAVRAVCAQEFAEFSLACTRERLLGEARRVLDRARDYGLPVDQVAEIGSRSTGLAEVANNELKVARVRRDEKELERKLADRFVAGVDWLEKRGLRVAAAALLDEVATLVPGDPAVTSRGEALAPPEFGKALPRAGGRQWIRWALALLPSRGKFLDPDASRAVAAQRSPWDRDTLTLVTDNLMFLSRSDDPVIVGDCLRRGETAVHALEALLYEGAAPANEARLVVLLHRNQKEYLAERTPTGGAPVWSAGYYSPSEQVSRFYVPSAAGSGDPLGRDLYATLAHELTHHWIEERWARRGNSSAGTAGYWVVEGIAQFVGDQAGDSDPHHVVLDNASVTSLDAMAQAAVQGRSLPLTDFIDLPQNAFARLDDTADVKVRLRNTLSTRLLSQRSLFYEQAAALTWFMMNRRGAEGRERLRRYLWAYYSGATPEGGWAALGFKSPAELSEAFRVFLDEVAGTRTRLNTGSAIAGGAVELPAANPHGGSKSRGPVAEEPGAAVGGTDAPLDIGDTVWVLYDGRYRAGSITGMKDGRFWVKFGVDGKVMKVLAPPSELKRR